MKSLIPIAIGNGFSFEQKRKSKTISFNYVGKRKRKSFFASALLLTGPLAITRKIKKMKCYLMVICASCIISCSNRTEKKKNFLTIGNGTDVEVTLSIEDKKNIQKIEFYSGVNRELIDKKRLESYNGFIYNFENKGEGTFKVCIYKTNDTICTESYVEKGYSPQIEFVKDSLIITEFIELNYE